MLFVTNTLKLAASTIATIYKKHWEIEWFFKRVEAVAESDEPFCGDRRERCPDPDLDNADSHPVGEVTATEEHLCLGLVQPDSRYGSSYSCTVNLMSWLNDAFRAPLVPGGCTTLNWPCSLSGSRHFAASRSTDDRTSR